MSMCPVEIEVNSISSKKAKQDLIIDKLPSAELSQNSTRSCLINKRDLRIILCDRNISDWTMAEKCMECGCTCSKCSASSECISLREEIAKLCKKLNESELRTQELELKLRDSNREKEDKNARIRENIESYQELNKRLKESYDETIKQNQELESQVLKMADELQAERARFDEALIAMTERLVDATEKMNNLEKENVKSRKDCALVVQLLKCNQSLDRNFVSKKLDSFPSDLKGKLQEELKMKGTSEKPTVKARSMSTVDSNENATIKSSLSKRPFAQRRSKSVTFSTSGDEIIQNGFNH